MVRCSVLKLVSLVLMASACSKATDSKPVAPQKTPARVPASSPVAFQVVTVLDFKRHRISEFAYCQGTRDLFVSFDDRETNGDSNVLFQWNLATNTQVATISAAKDWHIDGITPSPSCDYLVLALYNSNHDSAGHWEKYALADVKKHTVLVGDLGIYNDRRDDVSFGAQQKHFRITTHPIDSSRPKEFVFDLAGRPAHAVPSEFPQPQKSRMWVIESTKGTIDTHGLYYTDAAGGDHLITQEHWHDNYGMARDGKLIVTTTWGGEVLVWGTAEKKVLFQQKIHEQYGYLAYDEQDDRFLIGNATVGTTYLHALVRTGASNEAPAAH